MEDDPLTPDERRIFEQLVDDIHGELGVQIAIGRLEAEDGELATAQLIADVVWRGFEVRPRPES